MSNTNEKRKSAGALWVRQSKSSGEEFLSGNVEINGKKIEIVAFNNSYKSENPKAPDWNIFLSENRDTAPSPSPKGKPVALPKRGASRPSPAPADDDDVAF